MMTGWPKSERGSLRCLRGVLMMGDYTFLRSSYCRGQVCKMKSGTRTWNFDSMHLDFWFPVHARLDTNEPGAFQKSSSMAMKTPPKTSTSESHLKSIQHTHVQYIYMYIHCKWQWHSVYWLQTQGCSGGHSEEQKAAMALRTFLANRVCGRGEVFDNLLTWRLQVATSLKQVVNLMIYYECRRALFNWYIAGFPVMFGKFLVHNRQPMDGSLGW